MSLGRALTNLPDDPDLHRTLRDVLALFRRHAHEGLTELDVRIKSGSPAAHVAAILPALVRAYVLDFDSAEGRYRFDGDALLQYEIDAFNRRVQSHEAHVATNVAKFRERYGS